MTTDSESRPSAIADRHGGELPAAFRCVRGQYEQSQQAPDAAGLSAFCIRSRVRMIFHSRRHADERPGKTVVIGICFSPTVVSFGMEWAAIPDDVTDEIKSRNCGIRLMRTETGRNKDT